MSTTDEIWNNYEQHLKICAQCKAEYDLQEEGDKENCCQEGRKIIQEVETHFWNTLHQHGYKFERPDFESPT